MWSDDVMTEPPAHEAQPSPPTIRSAGPATAGRVTTGLEPALYPLEALCMICGRPVSIDRFFLGNWEHVTESCFF